MVEISTASMDRLLKDLQKLPDLNRAKFTRMASAAIFANVMKHFSDEKDSDGKSWKKWKNPAGSGTVSSRPPYYMNGKRVDRGGNKLLQREGRLRGSIVPFSDSSTGGVRTNVVYAGAQNYGTNNIPKREFMYADDQTVSKLENYLIKVIEDGWKNG